jgi:hypothetical protein
MRPAHLPTSDPEIAEESAKRWVENLFRPKPSPATLDVVYSFRDRTQEELNTKDRQFLDRLGAKVTSAEQKKSTE